MTSAKPYLQIPLQVAYPAVHPLKQIMGPVWMFVVFQVFGLAYFSISAMAFLNPITWILCLVLYVLVNGIALVYMVKREKRIMAISYFSFQHSHFSIQTNKKEFVLEYKYLVSIREKKSGLFVYTNNHRKFIPRSTESYALIKDFLAQKVEENRLHPDE